ncbi:UDP-3-O-(3-hydroxymyristoyl)glucosamine N-acyltransferase [Malikia sp.]|uniref:UDP-3-O-(3-hydroxymyristoyl)glucosamine N-acyltransferase n=1 Tax=Malikia sp. TaxID=2070706 RepID=UPI00261031E1|nr:UDP-3-O-(3-hydroxymyristoyl)glucosamine N-acyltransferase [Malikia sp.]MDD2728360.1 UDP-3-O-(3-hydroxymyristoyl)glucosamine N-acyltransferase [Malikia sp.]
MSATLAEIRAALGGVLHGAPELRVLRLASLESADADALSFVAQARYASQIASTHAGALIVPPALLEQAGARGACIETPDAYLYFARLTQWWKARREAAEQADAGPAIHPSAVIHPTARLGAGVTVGAFAVIDAGVVVDAGARIGAHCVLERRACVGARSRLSPQVTLGHDCRIGADGIVHAGTVIGADGFGFAPHQGEWIKIEQLGAVRIGDRVEIGANCCIDRGALEDTVIEDGVKLDNLIQIGHNVQVGRHTAMAGCAGVAGSARIGAHCTIGGGAVVLGHLTLADGVHVSAASVVMRSIHQPGQYSGVFPIDDNRSWEKNAATLRQLHSLRDRIKALEKKS